MYYVKISLALPSSDNTCRGIEDDKIIFILYNRDVQSSLVRISDCSLFLFFFLSKYVLNVFSLLPYSNSITFVHCCYIVRHDLTRF